ncbi:MAG: hypothetical protein LUG61_01195 [Lachnospiraceae bacterium]|nr:hypothetical protein [Lachnospiraceae bacterium]
MNRELCFNIENKDLYLEQILVDYMDIPIFFLCKGGNQYYIALCTDIEELSYIVTKLSLLDVYDLLHGKIPMRNAILRQNEYWDIVSGNEICMDVATKKSIDTLDTALLPEEKARFKILTKQMLLFVQEFDREFREFFDTKYFSESDKKADLSEAVESISLDLLTGNIDLFTELLDYKYRRAEFPEMLLYDERMKSIKTETVTFKSSKQSKQTETFKLAEPFVNNIAVAA